MHKFPPQSLRKGGKCVCNGIRANAQTKIRKYTNTNTQIQIHKHKYKYKYNLCNLDTRLRPTLGGEVGQLGGEEGGGEAGQGGLHIFSIAHYYISLYLGWEIYR